MINTVKYTSEYVYNNIKLDKTRKIIEKTIHEYEQEYVGTYRRSIRSYMFC